MYFNQLIIDDIVDVAQTLIEDVSELRRKVQEYHIPGQHVSYEVFVAVLEKAVELTNDRRFGLKMGEHALLKATCEVDSIMQNSMTIEQAFSNAVEFSRLISDSMECDLIKKDDQLFSVRFNYHPGWEVQPDFAKNCNIDAALVSAVKSLHALTGYRYQPYLVCFPYPKPKQINEYYRIFNCSIEYGKPCGEIFFHKEVLNKGVVSQDYGLLQKLKHNAEKRISQMPDDDILIKKIKQLMLQRLKERKVPVQDHLAKELHISKRTLQRNLLARGTSFNEILSEIKHSLAEKHLQYDKLKVEEISFLLGYSEPSAFIRAFKRWAGVSPGNYSD